MFKVIIEHFAWESVEFEEWKSTISSLTSMEYTEETKDLDYMSRELERCWPWPEKVQYFYDIDNRETIILSFNTSKEWDDCRNTPEFQDALDFDSLDFFVYLNVEFCKITKTIVKGNPPV